MSGCRVPVTGGSSHPHTKERTMAQPATAKKTGTGTPQKPQFGSVPGGGKTTKPAAAEKPSETTQKGPSLIWTNPRRAALVKAMRKSQTSGEVVQILKKDKAFEGVEDLVTAVKVMNEAGKLRKNGVRVPEFSKSKNAIDVDGLNALLDGDEDDEEGEEEETEE